jgi:hypothetical protein
MIPTADLQPNHILQRHRLRTLSTMTPRLSGCGELEARVWPPSEGSLPSLSETVSPSKPEKHDNAAQDGGGDGHGAD